MTHLQETAVRLCITEALSGQWFNIQGVTRACEVLGLPTYLRSTDWAVLQAMHCKHWNKMDAQCKVELVHTVARVLGLQQRDIPMQAYAALLTA